MFTQSTEGTVPQCHVTAV